jgi:hypothetical protein
VGRRAWRRHVGGTAERRCGCVGRDVVGRGRRCGGVGRRSGPWAALRGAVRRAARRGWRCWAALRGWRVGRCGEARDGARDGEQRASGDVLREKREERRNRTEKEPTVFQNLIFGGQGSRPPKIGLFSAAVSVAAENRPIFGGCVRPPKIWWYFWWPASGRRK